MRCHLLCLALLPEAFLSDPLQIQNQENLHIEMSEKGGTLKGKGVEPGTQPRSQTIGGWTTSLLQHEAKVLCKVQHNGKGGTGRQASL